MFGPVLNAVAGDVVGGVLRVIPDGNVWDGVEPSTKTRTFSVFAGSTPVPAIPVPAVDALPPGLPSAVAVEGIATECRFEAWGQLGPDRRLTIGMFTPGVGPDPARRARAGV